MYKVVRKFKDDKHGGIYKIGDTYPIEGFEVSKTRLKELSTTKNKYKKIYTEEVEEALSGGKDDGKDKTPAGEE